MPVSNEVRRLSARWAAGTGWPKRLDWLAIKGIRGWTGQRFDLRYPIMAVVGENGVGKSSVIQAIASIYRDPRKNEGHFASDFFPDTCWDEIRDATVQFEIRQGTERIESSIRKPGERWRGNPDRPERPVVYIDLTRIQPVPARPGYTKLVKSHHEEVSNTPFDARRLERFSQIMGRVYDLAKMAVTNIYADRTVPVLEQQGNRYSGFHQGAGETTIAELLEADLPQYGIILIDEIESSLHPRAQRRLIRDLADRCRDHELQVVITTHSPYILAELPPEARAYIMQIGNTREIIYGVSPEFAMTKMDDVAQPECDLYVEDIKAQAMLTEILVARAPHLVERCQIIPYGAASVGQALGQMVSNGRFPRPSRIFLDGDQAQSSGCTNLPGDDAPERVVFESLQQQNWRGISERVGRPFAQVADACARAMAMADHHGWVNEAATKLMLRGDILWQAMVAEWANNILDPADASPITQTIDDALLNIAAPRVRAVQASRVAPVAAPVAATPSIDAPQPATVARTTPVARATTLPLLDDIPAIPED